MADWVTRAEVARRLGLNASSVTRFLASRGHLVNDDGLVDFGGYCREQEAAHGASFKSASAKDRDAEAQAALRELKLRRETGELKPARLVADVVRTTIAEFVDGFLSELEERLTAAGVTEVRDAVEAVSALMRDQQAATARNCEELAASDHGTAGGTG